MSPKELIQFFRKLASNYFGESEIVVLRAIKDWVDLTSDLQFLSSGATRDVYDIDEHSVLKVAKQITDLKLNNQEVIASRCLGKTYASEVIAADPEGFWIIAEKLQPVAYNDFAVWMEDELNYSGNPNTFGDLLINQNDEVHQYLYQHNLWFKGLIDGLKRCKVDPFDMGYKNWGFRSGQKNPVLLDYAFEAHLNESIKIRLSTLIFN